MATTKRSYADRTVILDPKNYVIAWIAPLEIEAKAAIHLLDERHRGRFAVSTGDDYVFQAGSMGGHHIVIATLPAGQEYGTGSAAALASQVKKFFPNLWFGLLVGVAAGLPDLQRKRDIRLGDVLVGLPEGESAGLIPYDLGKETEDGFQPLRLGHSLAMTAPIVRSAIGSIKLETPNEAEIFLPHFEKVANREHAKGTFVDPGHDKDVLYDEKGQAIERPQRPQRTRVWYGPIGSGEKLLRNAKIRDELRDRHGIIGLEMEAAGTMNRIPVGVIRGVCDYGDRHKNKEWQPYAAAMAASYARSLLDEVPQNDKHRASVFPSSCNPLSQPAAKRQRVDTGEISEPCYYIPLLENTRFTGRQSTICALDEMIFGHAQCHRLALVGLGGVGKTQIALRFTYEVKKNHPECSVFWVPTLSDEGADRAFMGIAKELGLEQQSKEGDVKELVCQYLSSKRAGKWLLVVDNADDRELILGSQDKPGLEACLPQSEHGRILLTTRSRHVAFEFTQSNVIDIEQMGQQEAIDLFTSSLIQKGLPQNEEVTLELLARLAFLPLAITQAAAYINQTGAPIRKYLSLLKGAESEVARVLGREFRDNTRYKGSRNAVGTTWIISFEEMQKSNPAAINLLSFISCIEPKAIPQSLLPDTESEEFEWAIGTLCSYSFLTRRGASDVFDMHSLVHTATRDWLEKQGRQSEVFYNAVRHIESRLPDEVHDSIRATNDCLPHAICLLDREAEKTPDTFSLFDKVGKAFLANRRFREATRCFEEVCSWKKSCFPETNSSRLCTEHDLACSYVNSGRIKDAIEILCHVVKVQASILAEDRIERLTSEHALGIAYAVNGQFGNAIKIFEHVAKIQAEISAEDDRERLATEQSLGTAYVNNHQVKDAIRILEHAVAVWNRTRNEPSYDQLVIELSLANAYLEDGRIKDSITKYETVVASWKETLDERDNSRLSAENMLGRAYLADCRVREAIEIFEHVVAIRKEIYDEKNFSRLVSEQSLADGFYQDGQYMEAIEILEHIIKVSSETLEEDHSFREYSVYLLEACYHELGHE